MVEIFLQHQLTNQESSQVQDRTLPGIMQGLE